MHSSEGPNAYIGSMNQTQFNQTNIGEVKVEANEEEDNEVDEEEEEGFDALYIKRLLNLFKEKNIPLSVALSQ